MRRCADAELGSSSSASIAIDDQKRIPLVRIENGVLIVEDVRFRVGDRVELLSDYTGESFHGTIRSLNSSEMYCRLADGSKARVYLKHLRNGRVKIEPEQ